VTRSAADPGLYRTPERRRAIERRADVVDATEEFTPRTRYVGVLDAAAAAATVWQKQLASVKFIIVANKYLQIFGLTIHHERLLAVCRKSEVVTALLSSAGNSQHSERFAKVLVVLPVSVFVRFSTELAISCSAQDLCHPRQKSRRKFHVPLVFSCYFRYAIISLNVFDSVKNERLYIAVWWRHPNGRRSNDVVKRHRVRNQHLPIPVDDTGDCFRCFAGQSDGRR
jgi:hypothetical protein